MTIEDLYEWAAENNLLKKDIVIGVEVELPSVEEDNWEGDFYFATAFGGEASYNDESGYIEIFPYGYKRLGNGDDFVYYDD